MEKDVRIILASFNATWARRVFCAVSRINLYGGRYQWILAGPRQERWWREEDPTVNCTSYEILAALEGAFVVDVLPLASSKQVTISGLVSFSPVVVWRMPSIRPPLCTTQRSNRALVSRHARCWPANEQKKMGEKKKLERCRQELIPTKDFNFLPTNARRRGNERGGKLTSARRLACSEHVRRAPLIDS